MSWVTNNGQQSFKELNANDWVETNGNKVVYNFKKVEKTGDTILILDSGRNLYVSLNSETAKWGNAKNSTNNIFLYGKWVLQYFNFFI